MLGVDTNVLVRYLTNDDKVQASLASELLEKYSGQENSIFINNIVLCELVWVLAGTYKYKKEEILKVLKTLVSSIEFCFENQRIAFLALIEFEKNSADFSDILISLINNDFECTETFSFDKKASKIKFFKELIITNHEKE